MTLLELLVFLAVIAGLAGGVIGAGEPFLAMVVGGAIGAGLGVATHFLCMLPALLLLKFSGTEKPTPVWLEAIGGKLAIASMMASPFAAFFLPKLVVSAGKLWLAG